MKRRTLFTWLYRPSVASPRLVLGIAGAITLLLLPGLTKLTLRTDGRALVPADAREVLTDRAIREEFGFKDQIAVVLRTSDPRGIYNPQTLGRIRTLTDELSQLDGLGPNRVHSLANEGSDRVYPGTLDFRAWLDPMPSTASELAKLRVDLEDVGVYRGTLISSDAKTSATAILVGADGISDRTALYRRIRDLVGEGRHPSEEVFVAGAPVAESMLGAHLLEDLATLIPLSILVMALVFWLCFRSWPAVLLPLAEVGACLVGTFAVMGWLGVPVYLTLAVLPVILVAVGVADELHIFTCYLRRLRESGGEPQRHAVLETMDEMSGPVVKTSLTTAVAFLSFTVSPIEPVQVFGLFMAFGVLLCLLWSLTVVPALLTLIPAEKFAATAPAALSGRGGDWIARMGASSPWLVHGSNRRLLGTGVLLALFSFGILHLSVQDSWIGGFAKGSELRNAADQVDSLFGGTHLLRVRVDGSAVSTGGEVSREAFARSSVLLPPALAVPPDLLVHHRLTVIPVWDDDMTERRHPPFEARILRAESERGGTRLFLESTRRSLERWIPRGASTFTVAIDAERRLLHPPLLESVGQFEDFLRDQRPLGVGRVLGPHEHLATMNYMLRSRVEGERRIPASVDEVSLVVDRYRLVRGEKQLRELLDPTLAKGLVTVFLKEANFVDTAELMQAAREYERRELAPKGINLEFAGDVAVSQAMIEGIVQTQLRSLLLSLVGIALLTSLMFRSLVWGLLCVLPSALAILVIFSAMGWSGVPLGVATSMFAAIVLGIGVDYAIHLLERIRRGLDDGERLQGALERAVAHTAPAIVVDTLAVGMAFGLLCFSQVPANARLGAIVGLALVVCLLAALTLLPVAVRLLCQGFEESHDRSLREEAVALAAGGTRGLDQA